MDFVQTTDVKKPLQLILQLQNEQLNKNQLELEKLTNENIKLKKDILQLEAILRDTDQLKLVDQLTNMILSDLCQPLGVISNYANGCIRRLESENYKKRRYFVCFEANYKCHFSSK